MHLLIVEDDPRLARALSRLLAADNHVVDTVSTGRAGLELARSDAGVEAIVLDIGLPDIDGLHICRELRRDGLTVPIIMLTARDTVADRVDGLDAGADDYLVKPFAYPELAARLRALTRRGSTGTDEGPHMALGGIKLDERRRSVTVSDEPIELSRREFGLLEAFLRHPDQVLTRDQLLDLAWPISVAVTLNSVDAYVSMLRRKLGAEAGRLQTVRGVGYRLSST